MNSSLSAPKTAGRSPRAAPTHFIQVPGTSFRLAGVLQRNNNTMHPTRRLGIICHGILGHKNYLFQPTLANDLAPYMDTFRFDFRGNGDSEGQMGYSNWDDDLNDIETVVDHFVKEGYIIHALIGHSRGAISILNYASTTQRVPLIPFIVSISSRYNMEDVKRKHGPQVMQLLEEQGHFVWEARAAGKDVSLTVTKKHFEEFIHFDTAKVAQIPAMTNVLLCHGSEDTVVPVKDIVLLQGHLSHANTSLRIITGADHNYQKHYQELSDIVSHYFSHDGRKEDWARRIIPRWKTWVHAVDGVLNFRNVGDTWLAQDAKGRVGYFQPGIMYRSADISSITPEGVKVLESLRITESFDLRSNSEVERRGSFTSDSVRRHHVPVFADQDYSPAKIAARFTMYLDGVEGFSQAYMSMMPTIKQYLKPILDHIIHKRTPFVVHCTAGKDRTGVVCALIQMLCGVDEEEIAWEYELTSRCMAVKEKDVQFLKSLMGEDTADEKIRNVLSTKEAYMVRFLQEFHAAYGTITEFMVNEVGLTHAEIEAVRDALVVRIPVSAAAGIALHPRHPARM
ncbi:hypothetical protein BGZ73_006198 [Actinomortierella ambigua]|nr:hypothetical protein BGZ73_006198 [Actinomortierella ambigua]